MKQYFVITEAYKIDSVELFGSAISIYGSLKGNPRRISQYDTCQCAKTICGDKINKLFPTPLCADCRNLT